MSGVQSPPTDISRERVKARFFASCIPPSLISYTKMPPLRTPLGSISGNHRKGKELTPYMRGQIAGQAFKGAKPAAIAIDLNVPRKTVKYTLQQDELRDDGHSLPQTPRGKSYTNAQERLCVRHVRLHPKDTYQEVIDACGLTCKRSTVKKILKRHSVINWRAKKRPELTEAHALARLA